MTESAILTRAEQRRQATASRLTAACRRLTAERGLNGFTIEEVCDEVGVSRRTFFNYFASKEQAVLGVDEAEEMRALSEQFTDRGSRGWPAVIDDLLELIGDYATNAGLEPAEHLQVIAAIEREPKLLARFVGMGREREAELLALIAAREGVALDDARARAAVDIVSTILRSSVDRLLIEGGADDFGAALQNSLAALREVIELPRKAQQ